MSGGPVGVNITGNLSRGNCLDLVNIRTDTQIATISATRAEVKRCKSLGKGNVKTWGRVPQCPTGSKAPVCNQYDYHSYTVWLHSIVYTCRTSAFNVHTSL